MGTKKILISRGYGAGWSTWISAPTKFCCEYKPIIDTLESGDKLKIDHPAVKQFINDCAEKYDHDPYLGGLDGLSVVEIEDDQKYRINEYDGAESIELKSQTDWY